MVEDGASSAPTLPRVMRCVLLHPPPCKTLLVTFPLLALLLDPTLNILGQIRAVVTSQTDWCGYTALTLKKILRKSTKIRQGIQTTEVSCDLSQESRGIGIG